MKKFLITLLVAAIVVGGFGVSADAAQGARSPLFGRNTPGGGFSFSDASTFVGNIYWVDSGKATTGGDTSGFGDSPDRPFLTIDFAVSQCADNNGDFIFVMPGHVEDLASAETIDLDVAGISVVGIGDGADRPRIDFNHATAGFDIGANSVTVRNLTFRPSVTVVAIGVDIEAGMLRTTIEECEFMEGEAGDGTDEFVLSIDNKVASNDTTIRGNVFKTFATCNGCTHAVHLTGASDRVTIVGNDISGNYQTAAIGGISTLSKDVLIKDNVLKVKDGEPGIEMFTGTTGTIVSNAIESTGASAATAIVADAMAWIQNFIGTTDGGASSIVGVIPDSGADFIGADNSNNAAATTSVVTNADGSVLERLEGLQSELGTTAAGTRLIVTKVLTSSDVSQAGVDITGTASGGDLLIEDIFFNSDGTGLVTGTNFRVETNNDEGVTLVFEETVANIGGANTTETLATGSVAAQFGVRIESGKKLVAKMTVAGGTGAGTLEIILVLIRGANGATISAAP